MRQLIERISPTSWVVIGGQRYKPVGKAIYVTETKPDQQYAKAFFSEHNVLVISPSDNLIYFGKDVGTIGVERPFPDSLTYEDHLYSLAAEDYQIVLRLEFGSPANTEGEVRFWDYMCAKDESRMLSLAVAQRTGSRADIVARVLELDEIRIED